MSKELTPEELGIIAARMNNKRENVPAEWLLGYDMEVIRMRAARVAQAAREAEYDRLASMGYTDAEIEKLMQ